jgi:farnesyl-diphosphate farnesyltransferase
LSLIHKGDVPVADAKKAAEDAEAKKDVFYLLVAVLGTLLFISALMVPPPLLPISSKPS